MPITTRLTERLGVRHPIMLAPMDIVSDGRLAAAVSQAGGFGIIGGGYGDAAWLAREMDAAGDARVGVGFITWSMARQPRLLDLVLERRPPAVMLSFGEVQPHADRIKAAGALLICQVQTLEQARQAVAQGADVLVAQGAEAGGHGISRGTFPLVPAVVDIAGDIPVAAAGGIADGRGVAAALMLGADGVLMGSRFYASQEAAALATAKQRIVAATGDATIRGVLFDIARRNVWPAPYAGRVLANSFSERWRGREVELLQKQAEEAARYDAARAAGDFDTAAVIAGEAVDLIGDIPPAGEIVERVASEAEALLLGASNRYRVAAALSDRTRSSPRGTTGSSPAPPRSAR
jgi:nitronate monooxygenase